jgi:hypothetical protein
VLEEHPSVREENLVWLPLDLSSQADVVRAAGEVRRREERLDILGKFFAGRGLVLVGALAANGENTRKGNKMR